MSILTVPMIMGLEAILCLVLMVCLIGVIRSKSRQARDTKCGLADYLTASAIIDDGILLCKNGALMASWVYTARDQESSTDEEVESDVNQLNRCLAELGDGWMIHVDVVRKAAPQYIQRGKSHFPHWLPALADEERRRFFSDLGQMYESYNVITVTYWPPLLAQAKFTELMYEKDESGKITAKKRGQKILEGFKKDLNLLESRLSAIFVLHRLKSYSIEREDGEVDTFDDFLSHLNFCVTGIRQPIKLPSTPVYLDCLIGGQDFYGGIVPCIGRKYIQTVAIEGFPAESYPGILTALGDMDVEYRWSTRFIALANYTATSQMDMYRKKWKQKQRGFIDQLFHLNGPLDADAVNMTEDAETAISEVKSNAVAAGYYTSVVVLMDEDPDRLDRNALRFDKLIRNLGFAARIETVNNMDAFFGSLPGHGTENVRRPIVTTMNLADFLPTGSIWTGSEDCPNPMYPPASSALMYCVTRGNSPFRLNLHVRDLGHTLIIGPTGSGKSTLLGQLIIQMTRYKGATIFAFDKGLSLYPLTRGMNGQHYEVAGDDSRLAFAPLQYLETAQDRAWALNWIESILELNKQIVSPDQRNEIARVLLSMHRTGSKTLTDFASLVQDDMIRETIQPYTIAGSMGWLLDAEHDGLSLDGCHLTTFEIEQLMQLGDKWLLPVLDYLFHRIERQLVGQPAFIVIDEAWVALSHPVFKAKIREWLKVLRKANAAVLMATQSLADADGSGILSDIVESTATKIFLPNPYARNEGVYEIYLKMGVNRQQINIIAESIQKRHYYLTSEKGSRLFDLAIQPIALSFVGVSDRDTVLTIKQFEKNFPDDWQKRWLKQRGVSIDQYDLDRLELDKGAVA